MIRLRKRLGEIIAVIIGAIVLLLPTTVFAKTVFTVPSFNQTHSNDIYHNGNLIIAEWSYGTTADFINDGNNIDARIQEINEHRGNNHPFCIGIYTNDAEISANAINDIAKEKWDKIECYYSNYIIAVNPVATGESFFPVMKSVTNEKVQEALTAAGYTNQAAMVETSGINQPFFGAVLYCPEYSFLSGVNLYTYKYVFEKGVFVPITNALYDSYDEGFLEMEGLDDADGSANGVYVVLTDMLPESVLSTPENLATLPDIKNETDSDQEGEDTEMGEVEESKESVVVTSDNLSEEQFVDYFHHYKFLTICNSLHNVEWRFDSLTTPMDFTASATIQWQNKKEVIVDFTHSGSLPGPADVTIFIPEKNNGYKNGDNVYLYYINPSTGQNEFQDKGVYKDGMVKFHLTHCSKYIITTENHGESYSDNGQNNIIPIVVGIVAGTVVLVGICIGIVLRKKAAN